MEKKFIFIFGIFFVMMAGSASAVCTYSESEGNNDFGQADNIVLGSCLGSGIQISGSISYTQDVDVFRISSSFFEGDELIVDVYSPGNLNSVAGVFNVDGDSLYINDNQRYNFPINVDPYIKFTLRDYYSQIFVVIASSPDAPGNAETGSYNIVVKKSFDHVKPPNPQRILLDFDGAEDVIIASYPPIDVPPLEDSPFLNEYYPGEIETIKNIVKNKVIEDYADYDVDIYTTDGALPQEPYSSVYFGTYSESNLGVADNTDEYNEQLIQEAIVYTESFTLFNAVDPSVEGISRVIANVASHEIGHLIGLQHTADTKGIMDITASSIQMMKNQEFLRSVLEIFTFPIGNQDAPYLLEITTLGTSLTCSDSDDNDYPPGRNLPNELSAKTPGNVWDNVNSDVKFDYCFTNNWGVMEYYCNANTGYRALQSMACPPDYRCAEVVGADYCTPLNPFCIDYDDDNYPDGHSLPSDESLKMGGWDGRTRLPYRIVEYDYCDPANSNFIFESICDTSGGSSFIRKPCPNGYDCVSIPKGDLCVPLGAFCIDSDNSLSVQDSNDPSILSTGYAVSSNPLGVVDSGFDECVNYGNSFDTHVLEYYCSADGIVEDHIVACPSGTECHGAKCVDVNSIDSDDVSHSSGEGPTAASMMVGGFIEGKANSFDSCVGNDVMESYYDIDNHEWKTQLLDCGCGSICVEGANGAYCEESSGSGCDEIVLGATEIVDDGGVVFSSDTGDWVVDNTDSKIVFGRIASPIYRGYIEWDISSIPDDAVIEEVAFSYFGMIESGGFYESVGSMLSRPSTSIPQQIYVTITAGGSDYYDDGDEFVSIGTNTIALKDLARAHLQAKVDSNAGWFAIGMAGSSNYGPVSILSSESGSSTSPKLIVTYSLTAVCGNSIVETGEQCDPPGSTQSCGGSAGARGGGLDPVPINYEKLAVTGDTGTQTCSASCNWGECVPDEPVCGNDICEEGETGGCSGSCRVDCGYGSNCGGGGTGSFMPGTKIKMGDGSLKDIEKVEIGDRVLSYDEKREKNVVSKVIGVFSHKMPGYYIIDGHLEITATNPIWVNGEWSFPPKMEIGDGLLMEDGKRKSVESIEYLEGEVVVYNLEVEGTSTYFAEGILVHNKAREEVYLGPELEVDETIFSRVVRWVRGLFKGNRIG